MVPGFCADGLQLTQFNKIQPQKKEAHENNDAVVATVRLGTAPVGVAVNSAGTRAYVASLGNNSVWVIDTSNNTVVAVVPVGTGSIALGNFIAAVPCPSPTPTPTATPAYAAQVQQPINADGSSVFSVRRGVVPVKFTLTQGGVATCDLPPATIAVTRTAGGVMGAVNESLYSGSADSGSNFRIDSCQYVYNLNSGALGAGTYRVDILINNQVVGNGIFQLK